MKIIALEEHFSTPAVEEAVKRFMPPDQQEHEKIVYGNAEHLLKL